ncbi:ParB-like nuclease domain-containing protein [Butyrivibrio sp. ob235]|uniref:ParB N-terminal domain-containing protein n=1 Tax=Butyrivibrio sp. ob235 TaxID=1761780 RepID=UPI0008B690A9|nr:ParB N-terminal domain-containing protein [Butyrivibrio sp. ob235]SEK48700.1 ParB-like nuclease domain-containing protein [Butyrivibrio sp. ob235]
MAETNYQFKEFIKSEMKKYKGVYFPIKAGRWERLLITELPCSSLHPNPADEFCSESIGPSFRIISEYEKKIRDNLSKERMPFSEPIVVEKVRPDGYLILNGHHRWAAARNAGLQNVPVEIVNLTQEDDIRKMLKKSDRQKRVTFDLDEVVFADEGSDCEVLKRSLFSHKFEEKIRLGIPALFHFLRIRGYDIWIFTSEYYSMEYIRKLLNKYSAKVDGIVTGTARKVGNIEERKKNIEELMTTKYKETINIDNEQVVRIIKDTKDFEQYELSKESNEWSAMVMNIVEGFDTKGEE